MNTKHNYAKFCAVLSVTLMLMLSAFLFWQHNAFAQDKKKSSGARLINNRLVPDAGNKLLKLSENRVEVYREETKTEGSGPTARRKTERIKLMDMTIRCSCTGTGGSCATVVQPDGAHCAKLDGCTNCRMDVVGDSW